MNKSLEQIATVQATIRIIDWATRSATANQAETANLKHNSDYLNELSNQNDRQRLLVAPSLSWKAIFLGRSIQESVGDQLKNGN